MEDHWQGFTIQPCHKKMQSVQQRKILHHVQEKHGNTEQKKRSLHSVQTQIENSVIQVLKSQLSKFKIYNNLNYLFIYSWGWNPGIMGGSRSSHYPWGPHLTANFSKFTCQSPSQKFKILSHRRWRKMAFFIWL